MHLPTSWIDQMGFPQICASAGRLGETRRGEPGGCCTIQRRNEADKRGGGGEQSELHRGDEAGGEDRVWREEACTGTQLR